MPEAAVPTTGGRVWPAIRAYSRHVFTPLKMYQGPYLNVLLEEPRVDGMNEVAYVVPLAAYDPRWATLGWRATPLMRWLFAQTPRQASLDNAGFRERVRNAIAAEDVARVAGEPVFDVRNVAVPDGSRWRLGARVSHHFWDRLARLGADELDGDASAILDDAVVEDVELAEVELEVSEVDEEEEDEEGQEDVDEEDETSDTEGSVGDE